MPLKFTSSSAYGLRTANLGGSNSWTIMVNVKLAATNNEGWVFIVSDQVDQWVGAIATTGEYRLTIVGNSYVTNYVDPSTSWHHLALVCNAGTYTLYHTAADGTQTVVNSQGYDSGYVPTEIYLGLNFTYLFIDSLQASYRHLKYWNGVALTSGEVAAEYNKATPQKAGATMYWPLADATDPSPESIGNYTLNLNDSGSYANDTDEPSYVTAGASAVVSQAQYFARLRNG